MSRFYASIQGNRGEATRMGNTTSGMHGHIRGWDIGASVEMSVDPGGIDVCTVTITRGSNGNGACLPIGSFIIDKSGMIVKK
jgi:hypothetical protein